MGPKFYKPLSIRSNTVISTKNPSVRTYVSFAATALIQNIFRYDKHDRITPDTHAEMDFRSFCEMRPEKHPHNTRLHKNPSGDSWFLDADRF